MSLDIKKEDRVLIVAPHPDDESIGCGGLMLKYGSQCDVFLLTDGRKGYDSRVKMDEDALALLRAKELRAAAGLAGVNRIHMLGIPDGTLKEQHNQVFSFDITGYDYIFVPNHWERHKDHAPVLKIFERIWQAQKAHAKIYEYEVWSPIPAPTDYLDISELMERKIDMIRQYKSQIQFLDYEAMTEALNRYRGAGQKTKYAEAYAFVPQTSGMKQMYQKLPFSLRKKLWNIRRKLG